jgi:pimeloyl-ACP methyl ester carboxylesterase
MRRRATARLAPFRPRVAPRRVSPGVLARQNDRDEPTDLATRSAQLTAITRWGIPDPSKLSWLAAITQPTFITNGDSETMMITENSYLLAHHLPNAQLRISPDSGHGPLDQYPTLSADHVTAFLNGG